MRLRPETARNLHLRTSRGLRVYLPNLGDPTFSLRNRHNMKAELETAGYSELQPESRISDSKLRRGLADTRYSTVRSGYQDHEASTRVDTVGSRGLRSPRNPKLFLL